MCYNGIRPIKEVRILATQTIKKRDNSRRARPIELGIKVSREEKEQLLAICEELSISKIEFLIKAMKNYKEVLK